MDEGVGRDTQLGKRKVGGKEGVRQLSKREREVGRGRGRGEATGSLKQVTQKTTLR